MLELEDIKEIAVALSRPIKSTRPLLTQSSQVHFINVDAGANTHCQPSLNFSSHVFIIKYSLISIDLIVITQIF